MAHAFNLLCKERVSPVLPLAVYTIPEIADAVYSYPTLSDSYKYAAYDWLDRWQAWRRARRPGA